MSAPTTFKPATTQQLNDWSSWLSSPEAVAAEQRVAALEGVARKMWGTRKFVRSSMESHAAGLWPHERAEFMVGPLWVAYTTFKDEQRALLRAYTSCKTRVKTDADYDAAEDAYTTLLKHMNTHGELLPEPVKHDHKKPAGQRA
jgi:hypothetical protein